ncbi:MAG: DUF4468 domain-containing protein [Bacteroidales bacterium]|nr:DUF4468 domain-containing protein [Bacteroidales bacterium]
MMKNTIFTFCFLTALICSGQDAIILKSGFKYRVKIVKVYNDDSIHFYYLSDHGKEIKNIDIKYVDDYYYGDVQFPYDTATGIITYTEVVQVPGKTKDEIYFASKTFIATTFRSAKDVIQLDDKENGELIVKGNFKECVGMSMRSWGNCDQIVSFTLNIQTKDGRFKYKIDNFQHESYARDLGNGGDLENEKPACGFILFSAGKWKDIKNQTCDKVTQLISELKESITTLKTPKEDNSW